MDQKKLLNNIIHIFVRNEKNKSKNRKRDVFSAWLTGGNWIVAGFDNSLACNQRWILGNDNHFKEGIQRKRVCIILVNVHQSPGHLARTNRLQEIHDTVTSQSSPRPHYCVCINNTIRPYSISFLYIGFLENNGY